jgi:choline-glycine betaine transporter
MDNTTAPISRGRKVRNFVKKHDIIPFAITVVVATGIGVAVQTIADNKTAEQDDTNS